VPEADPVVTPAIHQSDSPRQVLFLCTGNYYRSRFAELLFNARARATGLPWIADSRGLALEFGIANVGPISRHVVEALAARGIAVDAEPRFPLHLQEDELHAAHLIIALCEHEHRPLLTERFPAWPDRVMYWHIHDVHVTPVPDALAAIEEQVQQLLTTLHSGRSIGNRGQGTGNQAGWL